MSTTLGDQIYALKQQTDVLRDSASKLTGADMTGYSVGNIANAISSVAPDTDDEDKGYIRPDWYPNIEEILENAPIIEKDGETYYPRIAGLYMNNEAITPFYKTSTTTTSDINYDNCTGCEAYIFSDLVNNDIKNANADTLQVGNTILHEWNTDFDISNGQYSVRWAIWYSPQSNGHTTGSSTSITVIIAYNKSLIELVSGDVKLSGTASFRGTETYTNISPLKFIKFCNKSVFGTNISGAAVSGYYNRGFLSGYLNLEEIIFEPYAVFNNSSYYFFSHNKELKKIVLNNKISSFGNDALSNCSIIKNIILPYNLISVGTNFCYSNYNLKNISLPDKLRNIGATCLGACYSLNNIALPNDLNSIPANMCASSNIKNLTLPLNLLSLDGFYNIRGVNYVKLPSSINTILTSHLFTSVLYVELFNDFDFSGLKFNYTIVKPRIWFQNLCLWLKDRTGQTANTMVIGKYNLASANEIYLTFNPENKRDITWVDKDTDGAISIVDYITDELNWTLS